MTSDKPDLSSVKFTTPPQTIGIYDTQQDQCLSKQEILDILDKEQVKNRADFAKLKALSLSISMPLMAAAGGLLYTAAIGMALLSPPLALLGSVVFMSGAILVDSLTWERDEKNYVIHELKEDIGDLPDFSNASICGMNRALGVFDKKIQENIEMSEKHKQLAKEATAVSMVGTATHLTIDHDGAKKMSGFVALASTMFLIFEKMVSNKIDREVNFVKDIKRNVINQSKLKP